MGHDENLLFGVFAVQLKLVTPSQIMEAAGAWATDPGRDLSERLIGNGALSESDRSLIDSLVAKSVDAHGGNAMKTLATFGGPVEIERVFCGSIHVSDSGQVTKAEPSTKLGSSSNLDAIFGIVEFPGRYSRESEHSRGGMGRVLLVHDEHLGRDIALKELLPIKQEDTEPEKDSPVRGAVPQIARFLQEARITSQLEHPSIVPVYELGHRIDGTVYYTMKLVRGLSLEDAIRNAETLQGRLKLLPHFVDLCHAIAYAHSRRVIHRDIKPANVMVGEFGETVVIDWGLAKAKNQEDVHEEGLKKTIRALSLRDEHNSGATAYGQAMGTPSYMSPEQAKGRLEEIDERSDIYSLGAVLYELLTGNPPFSGKNQAKLLDEVANAAPIPIAEREPNAPPELIAICERAMQKNPFWRYESASQLVDDVQRFQSGAVVMAHRYSYADLFRRFLRKNRTILATSAVAAIILSATAVFSYVQILGERDDAIGARNREVDARRAEVDAHKLALVERDAALEARGEANRNSYQSNILLARNLIDNSEYSAAREALWRTPALLRDWEWGYLIRLCHLDVKTIKSKSGRYRSLDISPDGTQLLVGADGRGGVLLDLTTGEIVRRFEHEWRSTGTAMFDESGDRVLLAGDHGVAILHDARTGDLIKRFGGFTERAIFMHADLSPDGHLLATASKNLVDTYSDIYIWDTETGDVVTRLEGLGNDVEAVAFGADSRRLAGAYSNGEVGIWDARTGTLLLNISGHKARVYSVQFSSDGNRLLTASADDTARTWDAQNGSELVRFEGHSGNVLAAKYSPDDSLVLTASSDRTARIWNSETGETITEYRGHSGSVVDAAFTADGSRVVTISSDLTAKVWSTREPREKYLWREAGSRELMIQVAFSPKGDSVLTIASSSAIFGDEAIRLYDPYTGQERATFSGFGYLATAAQFSPDGSRLAVSSVTKTVTVLDSKTGALDLILRGHDSIVRDVQWSPDGETIASAADVAILWNARTGDILQQVEGHTDIVYTVRFAPDGSSLFTTSRDSTAKLWSVKTGEALWTVANEGGGHFRAAEFSSDGKRVFVGGFGTALLVVDALSGNLIASTPVASIGLNDLALNPSGTRLAVAGERGVVKILDTENLTELLSIDVGGQEVNSVSWSTDGRELAMATSDGFVTVWQAHPWIDSDLPGEAGDSWEDRYELLNRDWKREPVNRNDLESAVHHVVIAREPVIERLRHLARFIDSAESDEQSDKPLAGLPIENGGLQEIMRLFGTIPGDVLTAVNDIQFTDKRRSAIDLRAISTETLDGMQMHLTRELRPYTITFEFVEPIVTNISRKIAHEPALDVFLRALPAMSMLDETFTAYQRRITEALDLPLEGDSLNGLWIDPETLEATTDEELFLLNLASEFYKSIGLQDLDRVRTVNGIRLTSIQTFLDVVRDAMPIIQFGRGFTFVIKGDRSMFEKFVLTLEILPKEKK